MQLKFVSDELAKSVKKSSNADRVAHYKVEFRNVEKAAQTFEAHDVKNDALHYAALQAVFDFGQQIRAEPEVLEDFVREHELPWSKVTAKNPYNALIRLALPASTKKAWLSQCSTVLEYAHDRKINEPLSQWLEYGGISGRYKEGVEHFARGTTGKAGRSKALRLQAAKERLTASPLTEALSGIDLAGAAPGFFRSLVYYDGTKTQLVHVRDTPDDAATETYLLDLVGPADVRTHPLAGKQLFRFYRAIDLIVGSCGAPGKDEERHVLIWNDEQDDEAVTRLRLVSDAYTFTNAAMTLAEPMLELEGTGPLLLSYADAQVFRKDFQFDGEWRFDVQGADVHLANSANSPMRLRLLPLSKRKDKRALRAGAKPTRRTKHFRLTVDQMHGLTSSVQTTRKLFDKQHKDDLTPYPKPKRFQLATDGNALRLGVQELPNVWSTFVTLKKPGASFYPHRELAIADAEQLCQALAPFGDDVTGYFADSDVGDAALCIDHDFLDGDHFEYASPLVISVRMDRTLFCDDLAIAPISLEPPAPPERGPSSSPSKEAARPSKQSPSAVVAKPLSTGSMASVSEPAPRERDYKRVEANRQKKRMQLPATPSSSGRAFGAFITSCLPDASGHRKSRKFDFEWQLEWWRRTTDIPVHVIASNWTDAEIAESKELSLLGHHGGKVTRVGQRILIENRIDCLKQLYASDFDWGIVMDDDAVLMQGENHNSSFRLFAEMATNDKAAYDGVDVFAPIYGRKVPFNNELNGADNPYVANHVFKKNTDLKGSMIVVRNFVKEGRAPLLPEPSFHCHGEDTYLVLKAVSLGYATMTCWNMVLDELAGESTFAGGDDDRTEKMRKGHERLVTEFEHLGLQMKAASHSLDKREFDRRCWGEKPKTVTIKKP